MLRIKVLQSTVELKANILISAKYVKIYFKQLGSIIKTKITNKNALLDWRNSLQIILIKGIVHNFFIFGQNSYFE